MARQRRVSLSDLSDAQLLCMRGALGHEWDDIQKPQRYEQWGYRIYGRCIRCKKERTTIFDFSGREAAQFYTNPSGWLKITEPFDTADVRLEMVRRLRRKARRV